MRAIRAGIIAGLCCLAAVGLCSTVRPVFACWIPVFRYALEHWPTEVYQVVLFHRGPLAEEDRAALRKLAEAPDSASANLTVSTIDLASQPAPPMQELWEALSAPELPWMVVRYPGGGIAWSRAFDAAGVDVLLDSPARREVARRILTDDSIVWILLESGQSEEDAAAAGLLAGEIKRLEDTLEIPDPVDGTFGSATEDAPELTLAFSMLRLSRADPREEALVSTLVRSERDLAEGKYASQPMAFPVFGRGRILYALVGKGINERNIGRTSRFLTGPCACDVKASNPGTQLLMSVDWDGLVTGTLLVDEELPPLTGLPVPAALMGKAEREPEEKPAAEDAPAASSSALLRNVLIVAAVALAAVAAGTLILRRKKKAP